MQLSMTVIVMSLSNYHVSRHHEPGNPVHLCGEMQHLAKTWPDPLGRLLLLRSPRMSAVVGGL
jgi:hypothetical protein